VTLREAKKSKRRDWDCTVGMIRRGFLTPASHKELTELVWPCQDSELWQKAHIRGANVLDRAPNAGVGF